ncbi:hypothetical protein [Hyphomonas sp.]|uniref:hypothetical protein n=1 Tax=Hyphomonas sp. TaxID=87 RepID=UPI0032EAF511
MTDLATETPPVRNYWVSGNLKMVATGLTGLIAIFVALKATAYNAGDVVGVEDHIFRLVAFASLTVWVAMTIGLRRSGTAAVTALGFATCIELIIEPARGQGYGTLASTNLGIVFAYCGLQLYWYRIVGGGAPAKAETTA